MCVREKCVDRGRGTQTPAMCPTRGTSTTINIRAARRSCHSHHTVSYSKNPNLMLQSLQEKWSRSWHDLVLEQSFYFKSRSRTTFLLTTVLRGSGSKRRLSRCLPNTSTFVPNDCLQCLYCVLPIMRCAFGAHLDVVVAERRTPCRFVGNLTFPSLFLGKMAVFEKKESNVVIERLLK